MQYYIGIDNGTSGGMATISKTKDKIEVDSCVIIPSIKVGKDKFVNPSHLYHYISDIGSEPDSEIFVVLERGQKQPLFGCKGNFANGENYGIVKSVLYICAANMNGRMKWMDVNPKDWQKVVLGSMRGAAQELKGKATKLASIEFCKRMYPGVSLIPKGSKKEDDNLSDAMCIAHYALSGAPRI